MDAGFGVVPVAPERGPYSVRVRASKLPAQQSGAPKDFQGPWSDPAIAPFGPVQDGKNPKNDERRDARFQKAPDRGLVVTRLI
jgi:hypothetical protein